MKITIIGAGNMGGALAWGLARSGAVPASDLTVTARHEEKLEKFKALGLQTATDNVEAVRGSDLVFYAVKPWQMEAVVRETAPGGPGNGPRTGLRPADGRLGGSRHPAGGPEGVVHP